MNFFLGKLTEGYFEVDGIKLKVPEGKMKLLREQNYINKEVILGVRPEDIHDELLIIEASPESKINAHIEVAELMGAESILYSKLGSQDFVARVDSRSDVKGGDNLELAFDMNKVHFFDKETEERIR